MQSEPSSRASSRHFHIVVGWAGLMILLALHLDFWRPPRTALYFGWLPAELAYRLLWMLLATVYLHYFCRRVWRSLP